MAGNRTAADFPELLIDVGRILPRGLNQTAAGLVIGAGTTFQEVLESPLAFSALQASARSMANRNIRNRATVGGNLAFNKSCASLVPLCLALDAAVECAGGGPANQTLPLAKWLIKPAGLLLNLILPAGGGRSAAFARSSRTACDVSTATVAAVATVKGRRLLELCLVVGGFSLHALRRLDIEALFDGRDLDDLAATEAAIRPLLSAIDDQRGSSAFKRQQGAALVADCLQALLSAEVLP